MGGGFEVVQDFEGSPELNLTLRCEVLVETGYDVTYSLEGPGCVWRLSQEEENLLEKSLAKIWMQDIAK